MAYWLAIRRRLNKSEDMPDYKQNLSEIAKRAGIAAVAKAIVDEDRAFGIDEHELTTLVIGCAKREHPQLTDAQAFAKVFTAQDEAGVVLRRAFAVVKSAAHAADVDDSAEACRELQEIGKRRWPV